MARPRLALTTLTLLAVACGGASPEQRDALVAGRAAIAGCTEELRIAGRNGRYLVEGCLRRVTIECDWEQGHRTCVTAEDARLAREAQRRREDERREAERSRREARARQEAQEPEVVTSPRTRDPFGRRASFTRQPGDAIQLELRAHTLLLVARTSREHRDETLVTVTIDSRSLVDCTRALTILRDGREEASHMPDRVEGATAHYVLSATEFDGLLDRTPLAFRACGETAPVESAELAQLRRFVAARRAMP